MVNRNERDVVLNLSRRRSLSWKIAAFLENATTCRIVTLNDNQKISKFFEMNIPYLNSLLFLQTCSTDTFQVNRP